jgi:hypothetical protein
MDQNSLVLLLTYIRRSMGIAPTTGAEWEAVRSCLAILEGSVNGALTIEVKPAPAPTTTRKK